MSVRTLRVELSPSYPVHVGAGALALLGEAVARFAACALLTDTRVEALHGERLEGLGAAARLALEPGEDAKDLSGLRHVLDFLAGAGLGRDGLLVTFGGGVVSDLGGLAASLYMRGIAVVHAPTTLLAQVDAAIGGKTGVNLRAGKNLAGTFHQPQAVLCDTSLLATLDEADLRSGLGEVLKSALLAGEADLARLERAAPRLLARDADALAEVVAACVALKARTVAADEREGGPRRALNLGHTFAHAIERAAGYGRVPHGVAVAVGLALALRLSADLGVLRDAELPDRVTALLSGLGLPSSLDALRADYRTELAAIDLEAAMGLDKKGRAGRPRFVLLAAAGEPVLDAEVSPAALPSVLA
ncbi:MAG TPA: 3-dehydroquinate synthase [Planctomycetota bacterium]|nr:3-dehydroquinate synthase [Planctomycetota bacterium]